MTVITQADFDFSDNNVITDITGGADGDAGLYVSGGGSVPDPPSGAGTEGDYCRIFDTPLPTVSSSKTSTQPWIKASVESGVFHGAQPTNQAYSLRAWLRQVNSGSRHASIGFGMRLDPSVTTTGGNGHAFGGYGCLLGNMGATGGNAGSTLHCFARTPTATTDGTFPALNPISYSIGDWIKVRMDVVHLPAVQDTVTWFTGTGATGSEVWTQEAQYIIPVAAAAYNDPATVANRTCILYVGQGLASPLASTVVMIDRFQAIMSIAS